MSFAKVYEDILDSSIWFESHATRIVWITMLAMANEDGFVPAIPRAIAARAKVSQEELDEALRILQSPDPESRSKEHDGRRIEHIQGGFLILNHGAWRRGNPHSSGAKRTRAYRDRVKFDTPAPDQGQRHLVSPRVTSRHAVSVSVSDSVSRSDLKTDQVTSKDSDICPRPPKRRQGLWRQVPKGWEPNDAHRELAEKLRVDITAELEKFRDWEFSKPKSDADAAFRNWIRNAPTINSQTKRGQGPPITEADAHYLAKQAKQVSARQGRAAELRRLYGDIPMETET